MQITTITQEEASEIADALHLKYAAAYDSTMPIYVPYPTHVPYVPQELPDLMVQEVF